MQPERTRATDQQVQGKSRRAGTTPDASPAVSLRRAVAAAAAAREERRWPAAGSGMYLAFLAACLTRFSCWACSAMFATSAGSSRASRRALFCAIRSNRSLSASVSCSSAMLPPRSRGTIQRRQSLRACSLYEAHWHPQQFQTEYSMRLSQFCRRLETATGAAACCARCAQHACAQHAALAPCATAAT